MCLKSVLFQPLVFEVDVPVTTFSMLVTITDFLLSGGTLFT